MTSYVLDFTIFMTFSTPNESTNFLIEQCLQSNFGKRGSFLFYFRSTDMVFGLLSFWQFLSTFWQIASAAVVSSGYYRLLGRFIVFPFGSGTHEARISFSRLSINCTIFPILHLLLGALFDMNGLSHHWIHAWFDSWFLQA